jgi:hypothetical protein
MKENSKVSRRGFLEQVPQLLQQSPFSPLTQLRVLDIKHLVTS